MKGFHFVPDSLNIDFAGMRWIGFIATLIMIVGSIGLTATKGLNFGVDFTGGTAIEVMVPVDPNLDGLRSGLNGLGVGAVSLQEFGEPKDLLIRMQQQEGGPDPSSPDGSAAARAQKEAIDKVRAYLDDTYKDAGAVDYRRTEFVGPQIGEELKQQGMYAMFFALLGIMAYVWFRFEWQYGVAGIFSTTQDVITVIGLFALLQIEFNLATVAAMLLVGGYSINDTVVVFDRIREDLRKYKKMPMAGIINHAINSTLPRTTLTSLTTLLALAALYFWGGEVIRGFVIALICGILVGTYSSIFVASPILLYLNVKRSSLADDQQEPQAV